MTDPLLSLCYPGVFGLYVVYALIHPLRENGCAQVLRNVILISASELDFILLPVMRHFPTCFARVINVCLELGLVWSLSVQKNV